MSIYKSREAELLHRGQEVTQWVNVDGIWKPVDEFGYKYGEFPPCTVKCGSKTVYRERTCKMNGTVVVDDAICQAAGVPQESVGLTCSSVPCTLSCSASCCCHCGCGCNVRFEPLPEDFGSNPRIQVTATVNVDRIGGIMSIYSPSGGSQQLYGYGYNPSGIYTLAPQHRVPGSYFIVYLSAAKPNGTCNSVSLTVTLMLD